MTCQGYLDKFFEATERHNEASAQAELRKQERDAALLAAQRETGKTVRQLAADTGLSPGRVHQILKRARG